MDDYVVLVKDKRNGHVIAWLMPGMNSHFVAVRAFKERRRERLSFSADNIEVIGAARLNTGGYEVYEVADSCDHSCEHHEPHGPLKSKLTL